MNNTITYGYKVAGVGIEPIPPFMEAKEFDSTANTRMSSEQSQVTSPEAAVSEPPPAALNSAATAFAPAAAPGVIITATELPVPTPEGAVAAVATDEVTSTAAAAAAPNKTKDEQGDKEEVPGAAASVAAAAGVATTGVGSAHNMDGERCVRELAPSTPQPAAGAEGVEMFTTPMQQLLVDDSCLETLTCLSQGRRTMICSKTLAR